MKPPFDFACPVCRTPLDMVTEEKYICPADGSTYRREEGVWRFLPPELDLYYRKFIEEYKSVRRAEGRGENEDSYYRCLPFRDLSGLFSADWKIRARSFEGLLRKVVAPLEAALQRPLRILDLGAGNGWLSYRLALRGHLVAAVDLQTDPLDGLGAYVHYDREYLPVQADFNYLPIQDGQVDLVIFNASFHYSTDYSTSLGEALRVLDPGGMLAILDSPIYRSASSGELMVRERETQFQEKYGFASNAIPSENYLTYRRMAELSRDCGVEWRFMNTFYGLGWALRPLRARLAGRREPARFQTVVGRRLPEA